MLLTTFLDTAVRYARKQAVRDAGSELTYHQLVLRAAMFSRLIAAGSHGPHVGVLLPSSPDAVACFYGTMWAGRIVVPLNILLTASELKAIVEDAGIDLIVSCSEFQQTAELLPARAVFVDQLAPGQASPSDRLPLPGAPPARPEDIAVILYTSGTTGQPRGVCLSHRNLHSNATACARHLQLGDNDQFLGVLPLSHSFGLTTTLLIPTLLGAAVEFHRHFQPLEVLRAIAGGGPTVLMATASMFGALARTKTIIPAMLSRLRIAVSGGEPLPHAVFDDYQNRLAFTILEGYGLTETSPVVSVNQPGANRPGTVGRTLPGVSVSIRDEQGRTVPLGEQGEICVLGPNVMPGYYHRAEDTAVAFTGDGWLRTGDLGRIDAEGFTTIAGRKKEIIIVAGENVLPREIEAVLDSHPAVAQSAVIGVPDASRGEIVVGFVVPKDTAEITALELRKHCRLRLAGFKVPRQIIIHRDLPRGPTGKIAKRLLRLLPGFASPPAVPAQNRGSRLLDQLNRDQPGA